MSSSTIVNPVLAAMPSSRCAVWGDSVAPVVPTPLGSVPLSSPMLNAVVVGSWNRFQEIQVVALMEANRTLAYAAME